MEKRRSLEAGAEVTKANRGARERRFNKRDSPQTGTLRRRRWLRRNCICPGTLGCWPARRKTKKRDGGAAQQQSTAILTFAPKAPTDTHQSSLDELLLARLSVLLFAAPGLERRRLQGTSVREGQGPGPVQGALVHGVQVDRGLLLALTAGQEGDA